MQQEPGPSDFCAGGALGFRACGVGFRVWDVWG